MGLEVQVTIWAYDSEWAGISGTIFKRYRLINKSGSVIDSMFIGQFSNTDIGAYGDDFVGCDTLLDMGYGYNDVRIDNVYFGPLNLAPTAISYVFLQGPVVHSPGDTAWIGFDDLLNYKNLSMTSFYYDPSGSPWGGPDLGHYEGTLMAYNLLNGFVPSAYDQIPWIVRSGPDKGKITKFPLSGNPVTGEGDVDYKIWSSGERNFTVSCGPFKMQPGEMQEFVFAVLGAEGDVTMDNLVSVGQLKYLAGYLHQIYPDLESMPPSEYKNPEPDDPLPTANMFILGQNFPNPFNSNTTIRFMLYSEMDIQIDIYNTVGQKVKSLFEGRKTKQEHFIDWDGMNDNNQLLPSGLYFVRMQSGARIQTRKILYLK